MSECTWPTCRRESLEGKVFCYDHFRVYGREPIVKEAPKAIPKKSARRKEEDKVLKKLFKERTAISDRCELNIKKVCTRKAQGFDHTQKTSPANRLDTKNLKLACNACNLAKELRPHESEQAGISKSRFK